MKPISLEELEEERIIGAKGSPQCTTRGDCDSEGVYERCYFHTCVLCPKYQTNPRIDLMEFYSDG